MQKANSVRYIKTSRIHWHKTLLFAFIEWIACVRFRPYVGEEWYVSYPRKYRHLIQRIILRSGVQRFDSSDRYIISVLHRRIVECRIHHLSGMDSKFHDWNETSTWNPH
jgi:hypothetical protein